MPTKTKTKPIKLKDAPLGKMLHRLPPALGVCYFVRLTKETVRAFYYAKDGETVAGVNDYTSNVFLDDLVLVTRKKVPNFPESA